ncbi:MAG: 30S ribosomal protein S4 [Candidatus Omnitrophica bacterium]|nr:30S ribosomal protein S4 [Candidatus Omnitrophota bacterium]MDD4012841.1 30S ribosomal protein S4 [Candidatus Omnitrophota bacterium]
MARMIAASCRLCRREKEKLFLKGTKCTTDKCAVARRETPPGQHGQRMQRKGSNYLIQLREKQKAKRIYGILERQFKNYFKKASAQKGATGDVLLRSLETRLDNVVYKACFAESRAKARQMVLHRHVKVNGRKLNVPSYQVVPGDEITLSGSESQLKSYKETTKILEDRTAPEWLEVSAENLTVKIKRLPERKDIGEAIQTSLIVELYSK